MPPPLPQPDEPARPGRRTPPAAAANPPLETLILTLRQRKVILDADLAAIYGVPNKRLNEQVKRNADRFPADFMFQLTAEEWAGLQPPNASSSSQDPKPEEEAQPALRSQFATLKAGRGQHRKYLPYAFTEHGALSASSGASCSPCCNRRRCHPKRPIGFSQQ